MNTLRALLAEPPVEQVHVPLLRSGRHLRPADGACLTELAAALTTGIWTDHPPSLHPTIGRLARQVNDLTSDSARNRLLEILPGLLDRQLNDSTRRQQVRATVAESCLAVAGDGKVDGRLTAQLHDGSPQRISSQLRVHWRSWRVDRAVARSAQHVAATSDVDGRDSALRQLLLEAVNAARRAVDLCPFATAARRGPWPSSITLLTRRFCEPGCDWLSLSCTPADREQVRMLLGDSSKVAPTA